MIKDKQLQAVLLAPARLFQKLVNGDQDNNAHDERIDALVVSRQPVGEEDVKVIFLRIRISPG